MQKVIQRTATARKQAQRKVYRAKQQDALVDRKDTLRQRKDYNRALIDNAKAARQARWEDWAKGSLAPKRDVGTKATTFGAMDPVTIHPPKLPNHLRRKHILFTPGDRVCIIRGRDQGRINEITQVNDESETVLIKDLNVADIHVPDWAKASMGIKSDILAQNMPVPMDDIRHVIALVDPNSKVTKDHIIQHAYAGPPYIERPPWSKLPRFTRYVSGLDTEIPWPTEEEPQTKDGEWDTSRYEVDDCSWTPSLDNPPFPSSVLDELRNKYSRFRTRHDEEYVREKIIEEYRQEYLESQSLLSPFGQSRQHLRAKSTEAMMSKLDVDGNMRMDEETTTFIDRFMQMNLASQPKQQSAKKAKKAKQTA